MTAQRMTGGFLVLVAIIIAGIVAILLLLNNIATRKQEAQQVVFSIANLTDTTVDPAEWGKNFPRQFDSYKRTVDTVRTRFGGSEAFQHLDEDPIWRNLFAGYPFGVDYREERGHAFMLSDQDSTERVTKFKQPGACLHCHAAVIPAYRQKGREAGIPDSEAEKQLMAGFEAVCAMPYADARQLVEHPVSCGDCHDPESMALRVTRPGFINGIRALAESDMPQPHLASITRWQNGSRTKPYDPNVDASRQEMRSFVCGQCHVEYYFKGKEKIVTYPWHNGLLVEQAEAYYDSVGHKDWTHAQSGSPLLKAQHPEFEMWSQGVHARSGVACADCHMPYYREGAIKISDHQVNSPLLKTSRACQTCHRTDSDEMIARAELTQSRTQKLMDLAEIAVIDLNNAIMQLKQSGIDSLALVGSQSLHRRAQWRLDYVSAENSMGFHAPQESARILGEAIDFARRGMMALPRM